MNPFQNLSLEHPQDHPQQNPFAVPIINIAIKIMMSGLVWNKFSKPIHRINTASVNSTFSSTYQTSQCSVQNDPFENWAP